MSAQPDNAAQAFGRVWERANGPNCGTCNNTRGVSCRCRSCWRNELYTDNYEEPPRSDNCAKCGAPLLGRSICLACGEIA